MNQLREAVRADAVPHTVIQMDTVIFGEIFAFTGVGIYTKEADGACGQD